MSFSSTSEDEEKNGKGIAFSISFSVKEWQAIQLQYRPYNEKHRQKSYKLMSPYERPNVIQEHFFLHTRLLCSLVFKKAQVKLSGYNFLGRCFDCESILMVL